MSSIKSVAVAGATGYVGLPVAKALLEQGAFIVHALVREQSVESGQAQELKSKGAIIHGISYDDEAQVVVALKDVDVVISTVTSYAISSITDSQLVLMKASKKAGVKLFFPSEFAMELLTDEESLTSKAKKQAIFDAKILGLPTTRVFTGLFPDWYIVTPIFGLDLKAKEITIYGTGNEKATWTNIDDVGRFIAYILANVPLPELESKELRIQGDAKSFNEFVEIWEAKHNDKLTVMYRPLSELDERIARDPSDFIAAITRELFSGRAHFNNLSNGLYPNWSPKSVKDSV